MSDNELLSCTNSLVTIIVVINHRNIPWGPRCLQRCIDTLLQGRAQDLGFGYLTFSKVQPIFGRRYALRAARVFLRATVARRAAMVRCRRPEAEKKWPRRRGKWNWDSWGWWHGVGDGWDCDWAVAAVPRGGVVDYLSTRDNIRFWSRSSPDSKTKRHPKGYSNYKFGIFSEKPPSSST